jgi:hypothetical protein
VIIAYIATLNLPDTLNFLLAEADAIKFSSGPQFTLQPIPQKKTEPKPNLLESLSRTIGSTSMPSSALPSPKGEFPPGSANRREFFESIKQALSGLDVPSERPQNRRRLTQPPSRAASPTLPHSEVLKNTGDRVVGLHRIKKREKVSSDKVFEDAQWATEKQQFGVNGGLINAVRSAEKAGGLSDYKWVGTLGMVSSSVIYTLTTAHGCVK